MHFEHCLNNCCLAEPVHVFENRVDNDQLALRPHCLNITCFRMVLIRNQSNDLMRNREYVWEKFAQQGKGLKRIMTCHNFINNYVKEDNHAAVDAF